MHPIHIHYPVETSAGTMCKVCQAIIIKPILDFDDERLQTVKTKWQRTLEAVVFYLNNDCAPMALDYLLIHLADALNVQWPDYIDQLANKYGEPPHTKACKDDNDVERWLGEAK